MVLHFHTDLHRNKNIKLNSNDISTICPTIVCPYNQVFITAANIKTIRNINQIPTL